MSSDSVYELWRHTQQASQVYAGAAQVILSVIASQVYAWAAQVIFSVIASQVYAGAAQVICNKRHCVTSLRWNGTGNI